MTTAWVFPGQGSQIVGMGRDVYEHSSQARAVFQEADAVLGWGLTALCFDGPQEQLTHTEHAQPALLTTSIAIVAAIREQYGNRLDPAFVAGHSLGEYTALYAADAVDFATALRLVQRRGTLMAAARHGTMAAVMGLESAALTAICAAASSFGPVVVANENAPGQLVISGAPEAVAHVGEQAKAAGARRVVPLNVSAAFHSPLMAAAAHELASAIALATFQDARVPVVGNVDGQPLTVSQSLRDELVAQVTAPVRWIRSVEKMAELGVGRFVEIGAGNVLTGLIKRIAPGVELVNVADEAGVRRLGQEISAD
ncbi:MAG: ACP S-malonyltransferase [Herpetosiphon sp.]